jgi:dUTP pyrophosphatase
MRELPDEHYLSPLLSMQSLNDDLTCHVNSAESKTIPARGKALVDTQISIAVPAGTYGRIAPRSGLASKHSIHTGAGVIDADYRGCVFVLLFNLGEVDFVGES